jgi:hypothetical protein
MRYTLPPPLPFWQILKHTLSIEGHPSADGVRAVIRHIERAERHLIEGRRSDDDDAFNDVVYRTNQAFEGSLKEAYRVLTGDESDHLSPHQIEQHLLNNKVLVPRVLDLLTNYRRQWRNPSTHDHRLFFGDQEAFLAIVSVSAFVSLLLDQIVEAINYQREKEEAERRQKSIHDALGKYEDAPFDEQVVALLKAFDQQLVRADSSSPPLREIELLGQISGFLGTIAPDIQVLREPKLLPSNLHLRPDLILRKGDTSVIIELKRALRSLDALHMARSQLLTYLAASSESNAGVVYIPAGTPGDNLITETSDHSFGSRFLRIHAVYPSNSSDSRLPESLER